MKSMVTGSPMMRCPRQYYRKMRSHVALTERGVAWGGAYSVVIILSLNNNNVAVVLRDGDIR